MNTIATWIYIDSKGEESEYPQVGADSSELEFQAIYWRCVCLFYIRCRKFNPETRLVLFTNITRETLPEIEMFSVKELMQQLQVEVVHVEANSLPPKNYYQGWRNQFYIFDILHHLCGTDLEDDDKVLILDSDCVWMDSADAIWQILDRYPWPNYRYDYPVDQSINGITRLQMQQLYATFSGRPVKEPPHYSGGEIFAAKAHMLPRIKAAFDPLWKQLLAANDQHVLKFNEEAHTLSYLHFLLEQKGEGALNSVIKRMWTDTNTYRNIQPEDANLAIWHLPAEKRTGIRELYNQTINKNSRLNRISPTKERQWIMRILGVIARKPPNLFTRLQLKIRHLLHA